MTGPKSDAEPEPQTEEVKEEVKEVKEETIKNKEGKEAPKGAQARTNENHFGANWK